MYRMPPGWVWFHWAYMTQRSTSSDQNTPALGDELYFKSISHVWFICFVMIRFEVPLFHGWIRLMVSCSLFVYCFHGDPALINSSHSLRNAHWAMPWPVTVVDESRKEVGSSVGAPGPTGHISESGRTYWTFVPGCARGQTEALGKRRV